MPKNESLSKLGMGQEDREGYEPTPLMSIKNEEGGDHMMLAVTSPDEIIEKPFYGQERLAIVERALEKRAQKDERDKISPVTLAAAQAQGTYTTRGGHDLGSTYDGPASI